MFSLFQIGKMNGEDFFEGLGSHIIYRSLDSARIEKKVEIWSEKKKHFYSFTRLGHFVGTIVLADLESGSKINLDSIRDEECPRDRYRENVDDGYSAVNYSVLCCCSISSSVMIIQICSLV